MAKILQKLNFYQCRMSDNTCGKALTLRCVMLADSQILWIFSDLALQIQYSIDESVSAAFFLWMGCSFNVHDALLQALAFVLRNGPYSSI